jgi:Holliday junction resolvase
MTQYQRGDRREKLVMRALEDNGYVAWQSRQSRGYADIIALQAQCKPLLVQVKSGRAQIKHYEWNMLWRLARQLEAVPLVALEAERAHANQPVRMEFVRILGEHKAYGRDWPGAPYTPMMGAR